MIEILQKTVEETPPDATYWSTRLIAEAAGVSRHQVMQIWKAAALRPHRIKTSKISKDPDFADKVVDIVGLYMNPPDNALILSIDEKTQIQALDRTQPMLPLCPGQLERRTHDYKRHGVASLYAALDTSSARVIGKVTNRHRAKEIIEFLDLVDRKIRKAAAVHVVLDSSTHKTAAVKRWLVDHD